MSSKSAPVAIEPGMVDQTSRIHGVRAREGRQGNTDMARTGAQRKTAFVGSPPIHPQMASRTDTSLGAPPRDNNPPDASSPLPTDPTKQHGSKTFPVPQKTFGMKGDFDPAAAHRVFNGAVLSGSTVLPQATSEET